MVHMVVEMANTEPKKMKLTIRSMINDDVQSSERSNAKLYCVELFCKVTESHNTITPVISCSAQT